ncbi:MAG TPA: hypothetical protein DDW50_00880 [Firmicutes bacterium]|jgi:beta-glucosidase|nr:hypothetical protein [Bacillota bacterium]
MAQKNVHRNILAWLLAIISLSIIGFSAISVFAETTPIYLDTSYSFAERAADLVSRMTPAEKASQMISSQAPAIPRLGIHAWGWWNETLHGPNALTTTSSGNATTLTNTTSYPIDLSVASSWDPELMYREAVMVSDEDREVAPSNYLNLDFYSPTVNLARDPRWGRNDESYGEDPFLAAQIASQFVNGLQGKNMDGSLIDSQGYYKAIATLKHYTANNCEANRLNGSADMDDRTLREYYTAVFKGIIKQAQPGSVMSSYNSINGIPSPANLYLIDTLLRQSWGFNGYMTSDCDAVYEITAGHNWTPPGWSRPVTIPERMAFAITAGEDLDCNAGYNDGNSYSNTVPTALSQNITTQTGLFTVNDVDASLVRLFTARMELGEFDYNNVSWYNQAVTRLQALGLQPGGWVSSNSNNAVTETSARLAMAREVAGKALVLLKNSPNMNGNKVLPLQIPTSGPFSVAVIGYFANPSSMYLGDYSSIQGSAGAAKEVNAYNGIKNAIQAINPNATVTFYKGFTGTGTSASGLTTVDTTAVAAAAAANVVIVYVGTDSGTSQEASDRSNINLPGAEASLITQVAAQGNPNTIVVMETVGEVDVTSFASSPNVPAILWSCYNGERKGEGLADVLLGTVNPSGRLPVSWYPTNSDLPAITDYTIRPSGNNHGRTYMYYIGNPVTYPFGYGLSYSNFAYSNLRIDKQNFDSSNTFSDTFNVSVDVTNTSNVSGTEVVELYMNTPNASASLERPFKRLRGFQKVSLNPAETKTVTLSVKISDLAFFDQTLGRYVIDNGRYGIQIGRSSADADIQIQDYINVYGTIKPVLDTVTVKATQEGDAAQDIPNRVIFGSGKVIIPNITVAMSDETLYGYINKTTGSKPLPTGMTVSYSSNRNNVVSVDANGVIHAVGGGVATVTANVTYEGITKSADFVVYVNVDTSLSSILVNGVPLNGFSSSTYNYTVKVPSGQLPKVTATSSDSNATILITQATSVPGQATISIINGVLQSVYTINFTVDTSLGSLKVNGTPVKDFSPTVFSYSLLAPAGSAPQVTAEAVDSGAKVIVAQAATVPGQATITVSIGESQSVYTVNFAADTTLINLQINGTTVNGFSPTVYSYNVLTRVGPIPQVSATTTDPNATVVINQASALPGSAVVTISSVGDQSVYTVNFTVDTTLSSLTINGKQPAAFGPTVYTYNMQLPVGLTAIPQVTATATDPGATLSIVQATALPGKALITVSIGGSQSVYTVNFTYNVTGSDEFNNGVLGAQWHWVREDPASWSLTSNPGSMMISPRQGDLYGTATDARNILLQNASGDWTIETKLTGSIRPHATYQQGGLIVYQNDDNYLKLEWEATGSSSSVIQVLKETNGSDTSAFSINGDAVSSSTNTVWFRIVKSGSNYTSYYSTDGSSFTLIGTTSITLNNIQVGLITINGSSGTNTDLNILYDYFHTTTSIPSEIVNQQPSLAQLMKYTVDEGKLITFTLVGSDPDSGDSLTYSASNLPASAVFDPVSGKFSWTPDYSQAGIYPLQFTVSDGYASALATTTIVVNNTDQAPVMAAIANQTVNAGQFVNFTINANDPDGDGLTYSSGTLPDGASFDTNSRTFNWTPTVPGTYTLQFTASDGQLTDTKTVTIIVNSADGDRPPVMNRIPTYTVKAGKLVSFIVKASDPDSSDVLVLSAGNLPDGANFNLSTGKFSWIPAISGTYTVQFTVSDGQLTDSKTATIIVQ